MHTTVKATSIFGVFPLIFLIIWLTVLGVGIYLVYLLIKALRIYIKKNS